MTDIQIQLKEIMLPKPDFPYSETEVQNETDQNIKFVKSVANLNCLIDHIKDKENRIRSIIVPIQKMKTHNELLTILLNYRVLHEELLECGKTGILSVVKDKQKEIDNYRKELYEFSDRYVYEES